MARARTRIDPRREATRKTLLTVAEDLFAREGVRAVTIRQICAAAGSANNNVVSYHFGGKEALIDAVFRERLDVLEQRRAELLAEYDETANPADKLRQLSNALWRPLFEATDASGKCSYARFVRAVMVEDQGQRLGQIAKSYPHTWIIVDKMESLASHLSARAFQWRFACVTYMALDAMCLAEDQANATPQEAAAFFENALDMSVAALVA
ncbi:MAG: TetR family transcriptional regulator [Sphingomonadales bacterium]|nr:TetR family transcriptional regulator [Sphingomonadales bacterium]